MTDFTLTLPSEIIFDAFLYLDYPGLMSVKLTCKRFYDIIKARALWMHFVRLLEENHGYSLPEEESVYTVDALEQWVMRRLRVLDIWSRSSSPRCKVHACFERSSIQDAAPVTDDSKTTYSLLPGGRWLLSISDASGPGVFLYDLEATGSANGNALVVIDAKSWSDGIVNQGTISPNDTGFSRQRQYKFWIDYSKTQMTFLVAVMSFDSQRTVGVCGIVETRLSGYGSDASFNIRPRANFQFEVGNRQFDSALMTFNNRYLVVAGVDRMGLDHVPITVVDYSASVHRQGSPVIVNPEAFMLDSSIDRDLEFIHGNTFALFRKTAIHLFEVVSPNDPERPPIVEELHSIPLGNEEDPNAGYEWSPLRRFPGASNISMRSLNAEFSILTISDTKSKPSSSPLTGRAEYDQLLHQEDRWALPTSFLFQGISWSVTWLGSPTGTVLELLEHQKGGDSAENKNRRRTVSLPEDLKAKFKGDKPQNAILGFDEETGRLVVGLQEKKEKNVRLMAIDIV
ncbi:hypothetical protein NP233_g5699 [Leucocoprinus birnbaumii]|uniref:F-box domain-containing protein n=1 Tax=Leucocoprinus birnbaumii TaxID=56174 RepID=A0AAD5VTM0_9AGAR|nr:hypothetical protein NP233_g5699 [Leucocoprinus birnbaumii]